MDAYSKATDMIGKQHESNKSESPADRDLAGLACLARGGEFSTVRRVKIEDSFWGRYGRGYPFQTPAG
jgi:hypothetical protein